MLRQELDLLQSPRFKVLVSFRVSKLWLTQYVLEHPPDGWTGGVGYITRAHMDAFNGNGKVLLCGPPGMIAAMK